MKNKYLFISVLLTFIFIFSVPEIFGYEVNKTSGGADKKWSANGMTAVINVAGGPAGSLAAIQAALQTWTDVLTSNFEFTYGGATSSTDYGIDDGSNLILFGDMGAGYENTLGQNTLWFYSSGQLIDSDIIFNTNFSWATNGTGGAYDVQNVATHELGHSLSLADLYGTSDTEKTMYGYVSQGETKRRSLHQDDINGITYLYSDPACYEDQDGDTVHFCEDNCPDTCNSNQLDADNDGIGDVCDDTPGCGGCGQPACEVSCGGCGG